MLVLWVLLSCLSLGYGSVVSRSVLKVDVFTQGEGGYYCIKIPYLLLTSKGSWLAFGEARNGTCGDFAQTDLVMKRSTDGGKTWSALTVIRTNSSLNETHVIGNAAPVQERITNRILVPHNRDNIEVWLTYSDNDGVSWSQSVLLRNATRPDWKWIGLGPPASLQLSETANNRIVIPSYHSPIHSDGDLAKGHFIINDDLGTTDNWFVSKGIFGNSDDNSIGFSPSESQATVLRNGSIFVNSRGMSQYRIGSLSNDNGDTFQNSFFIKDLRDQLTGCEGSMITHPTSNNLYYSGLTPHRDTVLRYNLTIHRSLNDAQNWEFVTIVDSRTSAYSALVPIVDSIDDKSGTETVAILYERGEHMEIIFTPKYITFEIFNFAL